MWRFNYQGTVHFGCFCAQFRSLSRGHAHTSQCYFPMHVCRSISAIPGRSVRAGLIRRSIPVILIYFLAILVKIIYFGTSDELGGVHILLLKLRQSSTTSAWSCHLTRPRERKKCTQHYRALTLICSLSSRVLLLFWCPGMSGCRCRVRRGTKPPN